MIFQDFVDGNVVVFALSGKIFSCDDAASVRVTVKDYIAKKHKYFVLDMAEVPWINSEGIGLLAMTVASVNGVGGKVVLANINDKVARVLAITKCDNIIDIFSSRDAAVSSLQKL